MASTPRPSEQRAQQRLTAALAEVGFALPGSVVVRHMRCGKRTCRCRAEPPQLHGPYHQWTRKVAGKTVTRYLTAEEAARYQPWFDNARQLRHLTAELEALSVAVVERAKGSTTPKGP